MNPARRLRLLLDRRFRISARFSDIRTEILGGAVTFAAMIYILPVNSSILSDMGMDRSGVFAATALLSGLVTLIMGLFADYPVALSAGMGMNAYLAYTICRGLGYPWQESLMLLTMSGLVFFVFSVSPLRRKIIDAIPPGLKNAVSAGLGAFILFVGLKNGGIIVASASTYVTMGTFDRPATLLTLGGILLILGLMSAGRKSVARLAIPVGLLIIAFAGMTVSQILIWNGQKAYALSSGLPLPYWEESASWGMTGLDKVILYGAFGGTQVSYESMLLDIISRPESYIAVFAMVFVNLFDTTATLISVGRDCGFLEKDGTLRGIRKAMAADAFGALICAPLGTSTMTSFAESNVGISLGARTGLAAVVSGLLFLAASALFPVFAPFSYESVTAPALVAVGLLIMTKALRELDLKDAILAFSALLTILGMALTYSLSDGMGLGLISYVVMTVFAGRARRISGYLYAIAALFAADFALTALLPYI